VTAPAGAQALAGSEWRPVEMAGAPMPDDARAFLQFRAEGARLFIDRLASTRRACPPEAMDFERRFLDALASTAGFARDRTELALADERGAVLLRLRQTDWD
jgi:heat shock protein HslJ